MALTWLETPASPGELESWGMPPATRLHRATAKDGGTLIACVVEESGIWSLNLIYEPKAVGLALVEEGVIRDAAPTEGFRAPTYEELMDARWRFLPAYACMVLPFFPEGHPEARIAERRNLVLHQFTAPARTTLGH